MALIVSACDAATTDTVTTPPSTTATTTVEVSTSATQVPTTSTSTTTSTTTGSEQIVEPPSGEWLRTNPDLGGLIVDTRDMIWDGEAFYLLTRIGFGDVIIWQSSDGIEWTEHSQIGTAGTLDGPGELVSVAGHLIAAGHRDGVATVWIDEGTTPWREVEVGQGAIRSLVNFKGTYVALGTSAVHEFASGAPPPPPPRHAVIWTSWDAETWTQVAGAEMFGDDSYAVGLLEGPAGLLTIGFDRLAPSDMRAVMVVTSTNGTEWTSHEPVGLDLAQADGLTGGPDGYAVRGGASPILRSVDGIHWNPLLFDQSLVPEGAFRAFAYPGRMASFQGQLVTAGGVRVKPEGSEGNFMLPRVWIHLGQGVWADLGAGEWFDRPGVTYEMVAGDDRLVVHGETEGEDDDWALFTFVPDESEE
ncbi:MAG: hypothetical protein V3U50_05285 [Acidimicrobiia bacterium]